VGDLKLITSGSAVFLNKCIRNGHSSPSDKRLNFNQSTTKGKRRIITPYTKRSRGAHIMKRIAFAVMAALLLSANAMAAIKIDGRQARNMDDVQSLGVIYINHNFATESEADQALNEETDAQGATYYHVMLTREPGSNGNMHASADIYR
jgi:hypothetical protein